MLRPKSRNCPNRQNLSPSLMANVLGRSDEDDVLGDINGEVTHALDTTGNENDVQKRLRVPCSFRNFVAECFAERLVDFINLAVHLDHFQGKDLVNVRVGGESSGYDFTSLDVEGINEADFFESSSLENFSSTLGNAHSVVADPLEAAADVD